MSDAHIIEAGDSNALGYLNNGPAPYVPTVRVQIWAQQPDGSYAWNYMNPGVNTGILANPQAWGAEVQIANRWLADNPTGYLWIVKDPETVRGGTTLAVDWSPQSGSYFASTGHAASAAMHNLDGSSFAFDHYDVAFVGLGENDAAHPEMATAYLQNLEAFDSASRASWNVDKLVEYRITEGAGDPAENLAVRQAQWQADQADDRLITFKTQGFAMQPDHIHYAAEGHIALGNADYEGWLS